MLSEQARAVGLVLNDTLTLNQLAEGELQLQYGPMCVRRFVLNTCYAFGAEFANKLLTVTVELNININESGCNSAQQVQSIPIAINGVSQKRYVSNSSNNAVFVYADQQRLRQVMANYLTNSCKFCPAVGGTITLRLTVAACIIPSSVDEEIESTPIFATATTATAQTTSSTAHNETRTQTANDAIFSNSDNLNSSSSSSSPNVPQYVELSLEVIDNGCGVSAADQLELWQPYRQINAQGLQQGKGSGLGLSIARRLVTLHGGRCGCRSAQATVAVASKAETVFWLSVPCELVPLMSVAHAAAEAADAAAAAAEELQQTLVQPLYPRQASNGSNNCRSHSSNNTTLQLLPEFQFSVGSVHGQIGGADSHRSQHNNSSNFAHSVSRNNTVPRINSNTNISTRSFSSVYESPQLLLLSPHSIIDHRSKSDSATTVVAITVPTAKTATIFTPIVTASLFTASQLQRRILVVEDSIPSRRLLVKTLQRLGFTTDSVNDGQECIDVFVSSCCARLPAAIADNVAEIVRSSSRNTAASGRQGDCAAIATDATADGAPAVHSLLSLHAANNCSSVRDLNTCSSHSHVIQMSRPPSIEHSRQPSSLQQQPLHVQQQLQDQLPESYAIDSHGLAHAVKWPYDLILMDGQMPVKNGFDATRELREYGLSVPIIAVTGNALHEDVALFMAAGADEVLFKPLQLSQLKAALMKWLK